PFDDIEQIAEVEFYDYCQVLSFSLTPNTILELMKFIKRKLKKESYHGIVITQGTATLEETAYLADLIWDEESPIVFTGAMINASEVDTDGPRNVFNSIIVAAGKESKGKGVLVCMAGE